MAAGWIEAVTGSLEQKKQYRQYKARIKQLPADYRVAAEAVERYLMYAGGISKGDVMIQMYGDLVDLFEQSAANGTPIRSIFGDDPVEFVETFVANYSDGSWIKKERERLNRAIDRAASGETRPEREETSK
jgi:DNA-binding ferritin-like protein (Dps family)